MAVDGDWILPQHYGDPSHIPQEVAALQTGVGVVDMCQVGTVTLAGPDARRFCNGMFTNNIKRLTTGQGNRNAMCDDRGRVQGLLDVYCTDDDAFLGVLEGVSAAWFEERYQLYIVFDDVEMVVNDGAPWVLSLQGPQADTVLTKLGLPVPTDPGDHLQIEDGIRVARKDRTGQGGVDLLIPEDALGATFEALIAAGAIPVGQTAFDHARILAGRARWPHDGSEKTLVHELRVNEEVCNFNKGCYLGQEVINRIDVKGQVAKRITGLRFEEDALPPEGAEIWCADKLAGRITSAIRSDGRALALGVVRKYAWKPGTAVEVRASGRTVQAHIVELPFRAGA
jgi:folate-binding protein YgfZ